MLTENQKDNISIILGEPALRGQTSCVWKFKNSEFSFASKLHEGFKVFTCIENEEPKTFDYDEYKDVQQCARVFKKQVEENYENNS